MNAYITPRSENADPLRSYVRNLRNAVATTTCDKTVTALQQMLREAEARLQSSTASDRV